MKETIRNAVAEALKKIGVETKSFVVEQSAELSHGDYATGVAFQYAKQAGMSPRTLAEKLVATMGTIVGVGKVEVAGPGFINFTLSSSAVAASTEKARIEDMWGANATLLGEQVLIEYTSPNLF